MSYEIYAHYKGNIDELRKELEPYNLKVHKKYGRQVANCSIEPSGIDSLLKAAQKGPEIHANLRTIAGLKIVYDKGKN